MSSVGEVGVDDWRCCWAEVDDIGVEIEGGGVINIIITHYNIER